MTDTANAATISPGTRIVFSTLGLVRAGIALVAVIAAIVVWIALTPSSHHASAPSFSTSIAAATADDKANQDQASTAPQQQVANGWTANEYLAVIAKQDDQLASLVSKSDEAMDSRGPALLLILLLAAAGFGATITPLFRRETVEVTANV
ncbi:MAG: hypothetical protein QOD50_1416 [Actinomycetota bacterium]|nr:hypothetical protein [Actinomycetota bacterium]